MKAFSPALAAHLATGTTTLCTCWRVERQDGAVFGFTDHDRTIVFGEVNHEPATGLDASDAVAHAGLQVGGLEVTGAFASDRITENDLAAGLYDNARVESWLVNWAEPAERHRMRVGSIGEVKRDGVTFTAEFRSLSHALDQERGRMFRATCDADLGDGRCKVDLAGTDWTASAAVLATDGFGRLTALVPGNRPTGFFDAGALLFASGLNAGLRTEVLRHVRDGEGDHFELWQVTAEPIAPGDAFTVSAGCDKRFETCLGRFGNDVNFRGFPHMPGNDFALSYPSGDGPNSGGRLVD
ncbi:MAG: DUF2163 domain-containing protein [Rhizobiales bacterium]|nr:DUF2163 domain-containing protein [Hyphomicrobiales bacterium]